MLLQVLCRAIGQFNVEWENETMTENDWVIRTGVWGGGGYFVQYLKITNKSVYTTVLVAFLGTSKIGFLFSSIVFECL